MYKVVNSPEERLKELLQGNLTMSYLGSYR